MKTMKTVKNEQEISKRQLARELDCSPGTITRLVSDGVIQVLSSGLIDRLAALRAIMAQTSGFGGGWTVARSKVSLAERAEQLLKTLVPTRAPKQEPFPPDLAAGMVFLCGRLRDRIRFEGLQEFAIELGLSAKQAKEVALAFVVLVHWWIEDPIVSAFGKKYKKQFDAELSSWIGTVSKKAGHQAAGGEVTQ
jgi:hypothetical protein